MSDAKKAKEKNVFLRVSSRKRKKERVFPWENERRQSSFPTIESPFGNKKKVHGFPTKNKSLNNTNILFLASACIRRNSYV
jgi:hypothetical protein